MIEYTARAARQIVDLRKHYEAHERIEAIRNASMDNEIGQHIAAVEAVYEQLITGSTTKLEGGQKLWKQFKDAVVSYRKHGRTAFAAVYERVNELAVARTLLNDPAFADSKISYEPEIAADKRRIDFVVQDFKDGSLYIEVKTVRPTAKDPEGQWKKYENRREHHTKNVSYVVKREWMGAQIYSNSFSSRSKFLEYALDFEPRLAAANAVQSGRGLLIFCGTGMEWHHSELEDFADFYRIGKHRHDDPFAKMEAAHLSNPSIRLQHNIAAFGFMKRPMASAIAEDWTIDVRGRVHFQ